MMGSREELHSRIELAGLGRDLTALAETDRLPPLYPRQVLLDSLVGLLAAGQHVLLVGPSGSGKTALVEALAYRLATTDGSLPPVVQDRRVIECPVSAFQLECLYVNEFETRVHNIIRRCMESRAILVLDRVEEAVTAGSCDGKEERTLASLLHPYLHNPRVRIVATTTPEGYRFMLRRNLSFAERFTLLDVPPVPRGEMPLLFSRVSPPAHCARTVSRSRPRPLAKRLPWAIVFTPGGRFQGRR